MSVTSEQIRQASDSSTDGQTLADLAAAHPELQASIARNPAAYPGLLEWLATHGGPDVQAALAERARPTAPPPPPPPPTAPPAASAPASAPPVSYPAAPRGRWQEPSRSVPITFLNHDLRYSIALVALGAAGLFQFLLTGWMLPSLESFVYEAGLPYPNFVVPAHLLGIAPILLVTAAIILVPSTRRATTRALVILGAAVALHLLGLLLALLEWTFGFGFTYLASLIVMYLSLLTFPAVVASWFVARMRPAAAFALLPIGLLSMVAVFLLVRSWSPASYWLFGWYGGFAVTAAVGYLLAFGILVGIAWLGRVIAKAKGNAPTPEERAASIAAAQHAARVAHLQQWQAAQAAAFPQHPAPPSSAPQAPPS